MNTVPKAVREQAQRAEELHKQAYQRDQDTDKALNNGKPDNSDTSDTPEPTTTPEPVGQEPAAEGLDEKYRRLDEAHRALQGKYNAEVPRLQKALREAEEKLSQAQKVTEQAEAKATEAESKLKEQLAKLREEYGDDLADTMEMVSAASRSQQDTPAAPDASAEDRFWRALLRRVPDFNEVNQNPVFIQWLQNPSTRSGLSYQQELNEAGADLDVLAVAEIVEAFKRAQTPAKKPTSKSPEGQLAPERTRGTQTIHEEPEYTVNDWQVLQDEKRRGVWRGREAEARALEEKIHAALTGR